MPSNWLTQYQRRTYLQGRLSSHSAGRNSRQNIEYIDNDRIKAEQAKMNAAIESNYAEADGSTTSTNKQLSYRRRRAEIYSLVHDLDHIEYSITGFDAKRP